MPGPSWTSRYLKLLGLPDEPLPTPDLATLRRISRAHLLTVPFESITSVLRRRRHIGASVPLLDVEVILDAWIARRSGGLCFEVTEMLNRLLVALGYAAHPVLGQISFPGSHQAVRVAVDGRDYLVDCGNGAPFFEPIPLDATLELQHAGLAYRFRRDGHTFVQDRWIDTAWQPFCRFDLDEPSAEAREQAYQMHHVIGCSWVVDAIVLVRCAEDEVWSLRDGRLTHFTGEPQAKHVSEVDDYRRTVAEVFSLPNLPIGDALEALGLPAGAAR